MPLVGLGQRVLPILGVVVDVRDTGGHARACVFVVVCFVGVIGGSSIDNLARRMGAGLVALAAAVLLTFLGGRRHSGEVAREEMHKNDA